MLGNTITKVNNINMTHQDKYLWDFIEKHHPNYYSSEKVAELNDIEAMSEGGFDHNGSAHKLRDRDYPELASWNAEACMPAWIRVNKRRLQLLEELYNEALEAMEAKRPLTFTQLRNMWRSPLSGLHGLKDSTLVMIETTEPDNGDAIDCFHCKAELRGDTLVLVQQHY
jgi:hypothetical protein